MSIALSESIESTDLEGEVVDAELVRALLALRAAALGLEAACRQEIELVAEHDRPSARNLLHYVALRQHDVRDLQRALAQRGLSSLGRAEAHVLATIDAVLARLGTVVSDGRDDAPTFASSRMLLERHTEAALGPLPTSDRVRLMVTLPSEAARDGGVVAGLVDAGMDLARINCAHDVGGSWETMTAAVRAEATRVGRPIGVAFDLAGPKLRTGDLPDGPPVMRIRPRRSADGTVRAPARVRFTTSPVPALAPDEDMVVVPVVGDLLDAAAVGDELLLRDTRGRRRRFAVTAVADGAVDTTSDRTTYLRTGTSVTCSRNRAIIGLGSVGELPATVSFIQLDRGDRVRIRRDVAVGRAATTDGDGTVLEPVTIGCELESVFDAIAVGDRVLIDDGSIEGVVDRVEPGVFDVVVSRPARSKLKAQKGINLPDTEFVAPALSDEDRAALAVIAPLADLVSLSFVRSVDDVVELRRALDDLGRPDVAVCLKVEHAAAFNALPRLLLQALQRPPVAVMLARGDLAIEVGFERLAEVQEEVLWLCAAAHVPVIWATQVAESLAKTGLLTRAEVTDAAWASRAECVMLNKGPHIVEAIRFLDDVFERMHEHQEKGTSLMRRLSISDAFAPRSSG